MQKLAVDEWKDAEFRQARKRELGEQQL